MCRSAATTPTSVPVSTIVDAEAMASTAATSVVIQARTPVRAAAAGAASATGPASTSASTSASAERRAGLTIQTRTPPAIEQNSQVNNAQDVVQYVASTTPRAGPIMKEISIATESMASTDLRSDSSTACMRAWRTIEKVGTTNSPATPTNSSNGQ